MALEEIMTLEPSLTLDLTAIISVTVLHYQQQHVADATTHKAAPSTRRVKGN